MHFAISIFKLHMILCVNKYFDTGILKFGWFFASQNKGEDDILQKCTKFHVKFDNLY